MGGAQQWPQRPADLTPTRRPALLVRFERVERAVHWINATLFLVLVATGAILYLEPLAGGSSAVGRWSKTSMCMPGWPCPCLY